MHQSDEYYQDRISELECRVGELEEELDTVSAGWVSAEAEVERLQGLSEENEELRSKVPTTAQAMLHLNLVDENKRLRAQVESLQIQFGTCTVCGFRAWREAGPRTEACVVCELREQLERTKAELANEKCGWPSEQPFTDVPMDRQIVLLNRQLGEALKERDALRAQVAQLREALEDLVGQACEFIGPDEDGTPECVCCHMELGEDLKGHRSDCLANAIMGHSQALSAPAPRGITAEDVRPLVEAIRIYIHEHGPADCANCNERFQEAIAHAKAKGWLEESK